MAALTALVGTSTIVGLGGSSLCGKKLAVKSARPVPMKAARKCGSVCELCYCMSVGIATAKYDQQSSLYFDLEDLGNTTGNWDLYGSDGLTPYNSIQSKVFEIVVSVFTRRGTLLKLLDLGGAGALGYASTTASGSLLPIKNGPKKTPVTGPRGRK